MKLLKAIETADALSPNNFEFEEKLGWCNEVSLSLRRHVKKYYEIMETRVTCPGELEMPPEISIDRVEAAYLNGRFLTRADLRSLPFMAGDELYRRFGVSFAAPKRLRLVYLTMPEEVENICVEGEFNISESKIEGFMLPFKKGDEIVCEMPNDPEFEPSRTYVYENDGENLWLMDDIFKPETGAKLVIKRIICDETEVEAPYDRMYVEYLLAKIALYQHDYDTYASHMIQYNNIYDECRRDYKTRNPLNDLARFKNYW